MNDIIYINSQGKLSLSNLHENQKNFVKSKKLHSGIVGGYQSGKSQAAATKCITKLLINPNVPIAYYLPTWGLIEDMLVPKFETLFNSLEIPIQHHKSLGKIITPYGEIWMRSMDNPDRIVSYSVGYSLVDEVDVVHPNKRLDAMKRISSRNSYKKNTANSIDFVSTPEGFAFMYDFFVKKANNNKILFKLKTGDNIKNLGKGYIEGLKELYDEEQLRAYMDGEFVNLTSGTVYKNFDRFHNHSNEQETNRDALFIGMDFNIQNMAAVVHIVRNGNPIAVNEFTSVYDTEEMAKRIKKTYPNQRIIVYPDASGKSRSTSGKSDVQILKDYGFIVRHKSKNPLVKDRINAMNRLFLSQKGERKYKVNTHICPIYTEALEKQGYKNGEPDKTTGFDHVVDGGGYYISYEFPVKKRNGGGISW